MTVVGITGRAGSGKTTVSKYYAAQGFTVIDCDKIAHEVLLDKLCIKELTAEFGRDILDDKGDIDRQKLSEKAFVDNKRRKKLTHITHKRINEVIFAKLRKSQSRGEELVFLDIPLLIGYPLEEYCDKIVTIHSLETAQIKRLHERSGMSEDKAKRILAGQPSEKVLRSASDINIENNTGEEDLYKKSAGALNILKAVAAKNQSKHKGKTLRKKRLSRRQKRFLPICFVVLLFVVLLAITHVMEQLEYGSYRREFMPEVLTAAHEYDLDPDIIYTIIKTESNFRPEVVSEADARGLMQITEDTFLWIQMQIDPENKYTYDDMFDPEVNIMFGSYYYSRCLERYADDISTASAAYHSGWGTVDGLLEDSEYSSDGVTLDVFPYEQMSNYVVKINANYESYKNIYEE